jgi:hypothetical protein
VNLKRSSARQIDDRQTRRRGQRRPRFGRRPIRLRIAQAAQAVLLAGQRVRAKPRLWPRADLAPGFAAPLHQGKAIPCQAHCGEFNA